VVETGDKFDGIEAKRESLILNDRLANKKIDAAAWDE
jgi:hypothetical protein